MHHRKRRESSEDAEVEMAGNAPDLKVYFNTFSLCVYATCIQVSMEVRGGTGSPGAGVPDGYEPSYMSAGNKALDLCKSSRALLNS